ncbi:hypothetical protein [Cytobacillus firmus]|nr:hypothetical protein [Cytobacillus firmus]MEC1892330.1 hypothetical protein [Cytobacillus firmus]MED1943158.1 hypothetical protein [Cytobacillus firmus]MED4448634.1 hypothetical protein [Cytobacillus firmus]MED4769073.1 hypothetical protein [Cytobacillus firmus]SUV11509.1 Uncharacterised protein [Cytobacillus firmus]
MPYFLLGTVVGIVVCVVTERTQKEPEAKNMKRIQNKMELLSIKKELHDDLIQYLMEEFYGLYEYLSNGENIEEFTLPFCQAMMVLETEKELAELTRNQIELEFMEEVCLKSIIVLRIGIRQSDDIQLCYAIIKV